MTDRVRVALDVTAIPPRLTGAGVYVARLAEALARRDDVDLVLVTRRGDRDRWRATARVHEAAPASRPARLLWEQVGGPGAARALGVDVWHGPHYTMPLRIPVPTVVTIHDLTFFDQPEHHERVKVPVFRTMIRVAGRRAGALVCVSGRTASRLAEVVPVRGRIVVAPHGVDHERFRPGGDDERDRALLAAAGIRPPYVASLGTIEPRKNLPGLVRAMGQVRRSRTDLRLVLAGLPGWGTDELDHVIAGAGMSEAVDRPGYLPDELLPAFLRQAEVVAYPAFEEGFGLPVLEALACGAAVVTSAGTVMEDVAAGAALLAPPGDDVALAAAIVRALAGGDEIDRLRAAGPRVAAGHTWDDTAAIHAALYHDLAR